MRNEPTSSIRKAPASTRARVRSCARKAADVAVRAFGQGASRGSASGRASRRRAGVATRRGSGTAAARPRRCPRPGCGRWATGRSTPRPRRAGWPALRCVPARPGRSAVDHRSRGRRRSRGTSPGCTRAPGERYAGDARRTRFRRPWPSLLPMAFWAAASPRSTVSVAFSTTPREAWAASSAAVRAMSPRPGDRAGPWRRGQTGLGRRRAAHRSRSARSAADQRRRPRRSRRRRRCRRRSLS